MACSNTSTNEKVSLEDDWEQYKEVYKVENLNHDGLGFIYVKNDSKDYIFQETWNFKSSGLTILPHNESHHEIKLNPGQEFLLLF